ncbi:hypothetical protein TWF694_002525 [Orbilia ellipsospora]|uniref:Autophagy-related protein 16 domain-containing protein n=1 Tax=Orbilia ellipsospora TaxID=2528407 RepID=A0AAV9X282_9PEZI
MARAATGWRSDLLDAFRERDAREKAQASFIDHYQRLADRAASLSSPTILPPDSDGEPSTNTAQPSSSTSATPTRLKSPAPPSTPNSNNNNTTNADLLALHQTLSTLRSDLQTSQRDRTTLQTQLSTITTNLTLLQKSSSANLRELDRIKAERYTLEQRLKSRDEEAKLNRKMIENLQDEIIALNIQLNIGEQAKMRLKSENEELIARWVKLKQDEVEEMHNNSKYS